MTLGKLIKLLVPPLGNNSVCVKEILGVCRKALCQDKSKLTKERDRLGSTIFSADETPLAASNGLLLSLAEIDVSEKLISPGLDEEVWSVSPSLHLLSHL